ncbi:MAG: NAD(+) diphosphatase [Ornithinimicrobium sp.]|uniref:NAD(+) diphosphatase n=1 Tax=Ornithinimicrobium sp. TaxID=1977084 RepID=UPI0026DFA8C1|nr:NAD(+) diphosphatase [Ornithinimicrobium sp.]MDO5739119.1 NAD(+) diphosphatase [Ornithinimicrobium sp.]
MSGADETLLDLALSGVTIDRAASERAEEGVARAAADPRTRVLVLRDGLAQVRLEDGHPSASLVFRGVRPEDLQAPPRFLGRHDGVAYLAVDDPDGQDHASGAGPDAAGAHWRSLRDLGADLSDSDAGLLTTATALHGWHRTSRHCTRCGAPTEVVDGGWVRRCPQDGSEHYPRTDPAVIMAIVDEHDRILLGTGLPWPEGRVSVLAGFVEAGESLEAAVAREVYEEVGVAVTDLTYRGNQPWPFPASLMFGFRGRALSTELTIDPAEIRYAAWFTREELAAKVWDGTLTLPSRLSIARALIEEWFGGPVREPERTHPT